MDAQKTQMPASLGGTFGESSDMKRLAKVVADGISGSNKAILGLSLVKFCVILSVVNLKFYII